MLVARIVIILGFGGWDMVCWCCWMIGRCKYRWTCAEQKDDCRNGDDEMHSQTSFFSFSMSRLFNERKNERSRWRFFIFHFILLTIQDKIENIYFHVRDIRLLTLDNLVFILIFHFPPSLALYIYTAPSLPPFPFLMLPNPPSSKNNDVSSGVFACESGSPHAIMHVSILHCCPMNNRLILLCTEKKSSLRDGYTTPLNRSVSMTI